MLTVLEGSPDLVQSHLGERLILRASSCVNCEYLAEFGIEVDMDSLSSYTFMPAAPSKNSNSNMHAPASQPEDGYGPS